MKAWIGGAMMVACLGCAGAPPRHDTPGSPVVEFPSRESLAALTSAATPPRESLRMLEVESWQIATAAPKPGAPYAMRSPWDRLLEERRAQSPNLRQSPELACAALEAARFFVANGAYPSESLRDYLIVRCGATLADHSISVLHFNVPDAVSSGEMEKQVAPRVRELVSSLPATGDVEAGIGSARGNGRSAIVLFYGTPRARLQGFDPVALGLGVTLRGELFGQAEQTLALATRGKFGFRACEGNRDVELPRFEFFCPLDPDAPTRIQIVARRPQRALFETVLSLLERRSDDDGARYERMMLGTDAIAADAVTFADAFQGALSETRKAAGVSTLAQAVEQSKTNQRLAPVLFGALRNDPELADTVTLGLLAGWDVQGAVSGGGILVSTVGNESRPSRWLAHALESPFGRYILLAPEASQVAIGTSELSSPDAGAVVSVYSLFDPADLAKARETIVNGLNRDRTRRGKKVLKFLAPSDGLSAALGRIEKQGISAYTALRDAIAELRWNGDSDVMGWSIETIDPKNPRWPGELLLLEDLEVELGITRYKPEKAAWGQYAVLFLARRK